ncbi:uncharacterized protein K452DRAFT_269082 [Aplosporella prunicola CBS 121167]|uniref:DNA repair and recombination protein RAD54B n=1 Tax=Aplosporella prunicola CBS 121167 TaxID=1176127 RepID=A0A6A6BHN6_9PEZI|nr:uncharacterized protein K452DRAFT_269082 [Aplosporella prunicola CBS 121167]KAF2143506.1 hypothetical protein K452DRAFT_269082 [Aplosporella prunicola CBS 121167]
MLNKPFKSPLLARRPANVQDLRHTSPNASEPPPKKRRVSRENDAEPPTAPPKAVHVSAVPRKPLVQVVNPAASALSRQADENGVEGYYTVLWRKFTTKKNKTWDGDGVLSVSGGYAYLQDISGRDMGRTMMNKPLLPGSTLSVGGKDIEVDSVISKQDFLAGLPFLGPVPAPKAQVQEVVEKKPALSMKAQTKQEKVEAKQVKNLNVAAPKTQATTNQFKNPLLSTTTLPKTIKTSTPQPRHDPNAPGALVMKRPLPMDVPKGKQVVDVVIDPILGKHLREHQREGVQFLYECVMGLRSFEGRGAFLADDMGLGKSLQTITLLWTLLKQNPIYEEGPVVKKALIVCPATVVGNWRREFRKWLGNERIGVFVVEDKKQRLTDFTKGRAYNVMVIGYERFREAYAEIKKGCNVDIIIADEGHKIKGAKNKAAAAIRALETDRIVMLSGTPLSNDLLEFYSVVDLVNPGILGKLSTFRREFEGPIVRGRQPEATAKDREKGEARDEEMKNITKQFMLRREARILAKYLPSKSEHVLFCRPTSAQSEVYRVVLSSPAFGAAMGSNENALQLINVLKQVCNSPRLLLPSNNDELPKANSLMSSILESIPPKLLKSPGASGKLQVLDSLLHRIRSTTDEKVVIVSHYTSTLNVLESLLASLSYSFLRVDGSTPTNKRTELISKFNRTDAKVSFIFLLSAKAGGMGINLIGASRLILYDIDWNPAHDLQAMARIHRDGQARPCKIYRFLTMGALDEKIYQRQLTKQGLADSVIDNKSSSSSFTREELRDLFTLDESNDCQTHKLVSCPCGGRGNGGGIVTAEDVTEVKEAAAEETDDEELPELPMLLKASNVDMEAQEKRIKDGKGKNQGKAKMLALMQYAHIDVALLGQGTSAESPPATTDDEEEAATDHVSAADLEAMIDDEPLLDVLREEGSRVKFVFSKTSS